MAKKLYPTSEYIKPPFKPAKKYKWIKKTLIRRRKITVPARVVYRRRRVKPLYRRRKLVRRGYLRRIKYVIRPGYYYWRRYTFEVWAQIPVKIKVPKIPPKERWVIVHSYLDKVEKEIHRKYRLPIIRPLSRYGDWDIEKYYNIATPYTVNLELNTLFLWKVPKLPVKWKFNIYFIYYYARIRLDESRGKYVIAFRSYTFKLPKKVKLSLIDIAKTEIPKALSSIVKDIKASKRDVVFIRYAFFSATTDKIIRLERAGRKVKYGAEYYGEEF